MWHIYLCFQGKSQSAKKSNRKRSTYPAPVAAIKRVLQQERRSLVTQRERTSERKREEGRAEQGEREIDKEKERL